MTEAGPDHVCILLALHQGAAHLQVQLDSYLEQSHDDWSLIVSDDGPGPGADDGSAAIIARFAAAHPDRRVDYGAGPRRGFAANFLALLERVPGTARLAALSDQDDAWYPDRLARAHAMLAGVPDDVPAVYCARTMVCDADLRPLYPSTDFRQPPAFRNALVQSIGGGNTMALNCAAIALARAAAPEAREIVAHDWWLYQIVTGVGGRILRDPDPAVFYRQHRGNAIGANQSLRARILRIGAVLGGRFRDWNRINMAALAGSAHRFTPEAQEVLSHFAAARRGPLSARMRALHAAGVWRQSRAGTLALYLACLTNRL